MKSSLLTFQAKLTEGKVPYKRDWAKREEPSLRKFPANIYFCPYSSGSDWRARKQTEIVGARGIARRRRGGDRGKIEPAGREILRSRHDLVFLRQDGLVTHFGI